MPCCSYSGVVDKAGQARDMAKFSGPVIEVEKETIIRLHDVGCDNIANDLYGGKPADNLERPGKFTDSTGKFRDEGTDNIATDKNFIGNGESPRTKMKTFTKYVAMSAPLTTHILDTARGTPAANVPMVLSIQSSPGSFRELAKGTTDNNGRSGFLGGASFQPGTYKLFFDTGFYFKQQNIEGFYPYAEIVFTIKDPSQHYHVPLLLSPFSYSTYRGS